MTLAPSDMICFALYSAAHAMQQAYRPHLDALGVTYPQYLVLSALWTSEGAPSVGEIARRVDLESNTLTPLLKRLEALGLVERRRDAADERLVRIALTPDGKALEARAADIPACIAEKTGMSLDQLVDLRREVVRLSDNLRGR